MGDSGAGGNQKEKRVGRSRIKLSLPKSLDFSEEVQALAEDDEDLKAGLDQIRAQWDGLAPIRKIRDSGRIGIGGRRAKAWVEGHRGQKVKIPKVRIVYRHAEDTVADGIADGLFTRDPDDQENVAQLTALAAVHVVARCIQAIENGGVDPYRDDETAPFYVELPDRFEVAGAGGSDEAG